jgi:hypothetical protein
MANTIKLKRGSGSDPSASDLAVGEVALRTDNAKLFTKNDAGNVAQIGGGLSDVVDDSTPQLGGDLDVNTNNIIFGDSGGASDDRLTFGAGTDLSIYHNGTDSAIVNSTGDLYITNNGDDLLLQALDDVVIKTQGGADVSIQCFGNGGVELYADNNKRFETSGDGATLTGNLTVSGTVDGRDVATDGTKLDGIESNATADQTAAEIKTLLNSNQLEAAQIANNAITAGKLPNSEVTFAKIQDVPQNRIAGRISSGSGVLQELTAANVRSIINVEDGATADQSASEIVALIADQTIAPSTIDMEDSEKIKLGTGDDLEIYHDGSSSYISDVGTGSLKITTNGTGVDIQKGSSETIARFIADGAVELYHDNVKRLETKSDGAQVSSTNTNAIFRLTSGTSNSAAMYFGDTADEDATQMGYDNYNNYFLFRVNQNYPIRFGTNGTIRNSITNDGHFVPYANNTYDLGTSSYRWRNIYTNDLHLSNVGHTNDVDGSWGDWTIQEGESDLFLKNNRSGKKYKFNLTEVS